MKLDTQLDTLSLFSHELKTPLSVLQLGLNLLEKNFEKNKDMILLMKAELKFLNNLIHNILDLRLIENKEKLLNYKWYNFNLILKEVCSSFNASAQQKNICLDIQETQSIEVFVDEIWIACVLRNLLSNAIRFSFDKKTIQIKIKMKKDKLFCSITNKTSLKIDCEKVFDVFYTKSLKQQTKGTGLGLNLVKSILQVHGGEIGVKAIKEKVTFFFSLTKARLAKKIA
ncbi:MAG: HAMP domain-containing histidine kinase [Bdellovibrionales bacterium]|nr:HAMP domain-containing histidine kinase [Bdellovibrionales bacterium]